MKKYFIKENIQMLDLSKYGYVERNDGWYRDNNNGTFSFVDNITREIWKGDYHDSFLHPMLYRGSKYRINDLIDNGLVKEEAI